MGQPSRNAPCPCGSGKKYKKCCLPRDQVRSAENREQPEFFETDLDLLSNSVVDLIQSGRLDEAEQGCRRLMEEFPDQVDGLMRLASVYKASGDKPKAVEYFKKAAEFMRSKPDWYDEELIQSLLDEANALEASMSMTEEDAGPGIR
jgi:tetratricopeptide (TPR) repeat protein